MKIRTGNLHLALVLALTIGVSSSCEDKNAQTVNPLLQEWKTPFNVPPFDKIEPAHYEPAFQQAMNEQNAAIDKILEQTDEPTFKNTLKPFVFSGETLTRIARVFYNVEAAETSPEMQAIAQRIAPLLSEHSDHIYMNAQLYERIKAIPSEGLDEQQTRLRSETLKNFEHAGVTLDEEEKERLKAINGKLSALSLQFGNNTLAETNNFYMTITDPEQLQGLPENVIAAAKSTAKEKGIDSGWVFTPHKPSWIPFLTYAKNDSLREELYSLYYLRGDRGNENDNKAILVEMANLRLERARILGFDSHAHYVLSRSMAKNPQAVLDMLNRLWPPALKNAKKERTRLEQLKMEQGNRGPIKPSDWWYYAEQVRKSDYDLDEEALKPYLSLENGKNGIFALAQKLYGLRFEPIKDIPVYHPEVEAYRVTEANGDHLAILYLDFFPRPGKGAGAWCTTYTAAHNDKKGKRVPPIVSIVCNFTPPAEQQPALLLFDEIETLFHEFGHALHAFFSIVEYPGMGSTPRDFVETPSQLLEHWASDPEFITQYAKHHATGETIPQELIKKLHSAASFNQGFATVENLAASFLDMSYHAITQPITSDASMYERSEMDRIGLIPEILPRYRSTYFGHIFSGGYSSGYYSYLWSEAMDCDIWEAFKESGDIFNPEIAKAFREKVLQWGNVRDAEAMFKDFRGRTPSIDPLLRNRGLITDNAQNTTPDSM